MNDPETLLTHLIHTAHERDASDIHIEPQSTHCRVRYRIHGLLTEELILPLWLSERLITHIKLISQLNIAEKRLPQDGHFHALSIKVDIRVSAFPQTKGEKIVLRLLKPKLLNLSDCGCLPEQYAMLTQALAQPQGLILLSGPTGSGKTTTLYAALSHLNQSTKNIITIEDPVEIDLPGVTQVNVQPTINYHFADILRACLRQDPDIIFIGEIRDAQTAHVALQAAETGHLVLSSLHTKNAASTFQRLSAFGLDETRLKNNISLILSQRLLRACCKHCKGEQQTCRFCIHGYQNRFAIFECYEPHASSKPNISLKQAAFIALSQELTTQVEINRVLGNLAQ